MAAIRRSRPWLTIGIIVLGALLFLVMILAPGLGVAERIGSGISAIGKPFAPQASIGRYALPLRDGEQANAADTESIAALLTEHGAGRPTLSQLSEDSELCIHVTPSAETGGSLLVCAPAEPVHPDIDPNTSMPPEAGIPFIERIRAQHNRLSMDPSVRASWIAEGEELKEHRETLLADGYAVGTGIITAAFGDRGVMGTILEWSGGAEWIGYLWVAGDTYLVWGWAPDRVALDALLTR